MTNEEHALNRFFRMHPQYESMRGVFRLNIFGDVINPCMPEESRIIAKSDCIHSLSRLRFDLPTKWKIINDTAHESITHKS